MCAYGLFIYIGEEKIFVNAFTSYELCENYYLWLVTRNDHIHGYEVLSFEIHNELNCTEWPEPLNQEEIDYANNDSDDTYDESDDDVLFDKEIIDLTK